MVGQITYTEDQILFILRLTLEKENRNVILHRYQERFGKTLTASQLRYVKSKYGRDAEFGSALINGTLPKNGGNRKTAPPAPAMPMRPQTVQQAGLLENDFQSSSRQVSSSAQLQQITPRHTIPTDGLCLPSVPLQQSTPGRTLSIDELCLPSVLHQQSTSGHTLSIDELCLPSVPLQQSTPGRTLSIDELCRSEPTPTTTSTDYDRFMSTYDPNNPYGFQPVLQYYNEVHAQPMMQSKRKREECLEQGVEEQPGGPDGLLEHADRCQHSGFKRVKQESPGTSPEAGAHSVQQSSPQTPMTDPSLFGEKEPELPGGEVGGFSDSDWDQLLSGLDGGSLAQNMAPIPSPLQLPHVGHVNQAINDGNLSIGMTAAPNPPKPSPNMLTAPWPASSEPGLTFSETETNPPWSPFCDDLWGSSGPGSFPNYALPVMTAVDPAVDLFSASDFHGTLPTAPGGGYGAVAGYNNQSWTHGDVATAATANTENAFSPLTPESGWYPLLFVGGEGSGDNGQLDFASRTGFGPNY